LTPFTSSSYDAAPSPSASDPLFCLLLFAVDIVGGKYVGHVGVVERYTPMMVEVRLFRGLAEAGAVKTLNPVVMIRQYNIQLPVLRERTDILAKVTYMLS
jgi:hypothetical protein